MTIPHIKEMTQSLTEYIREERKDSFESIKQEKERKSVFFIKEDREKGSIKLSIILGTFYDMGGFFITAVCIIGSTIAIVSGASSATLLSIWGNEYFVNKDIEKSRYYIIISVMWSAVENIFGFLRTTPYYLGGVFIGRKMHSMMIFKLLHATINDFLKRTPFGIILNRFSNDVDKADRGISDDTNNFVYFALQAIVTAFLVIAGANDILMIIPLLLFIILSKYQRTVYMSPSRELTRLKAITKSPIVGTCDACIAGGVSVRTLGVEKYFTEKNRRNINEHTKNGIMFDAVNSWYKSVTAVMNFWIILVPCYTLFLLRIKTGSSKGDDLSNGNIFLSNLILFSEIVSLFFLTYSNVENAIVSIERCKAYENIIPEEGYSTIESDAKHFDPPKKESLGILVKEINEPEIIFPNGEVELYNVTAKYPTNDSPVLSDITLRIESGEKVGIVGRTGAGKSSFIKLLWRALTPTKGSVKIGGINILNIDLKTFRRQINVITQKPNLFKGTLLSNITHKKITQEKILQIKKQMLDLGFSPSKLEKENLGFEVTILGENLSQSEKQIVGLMHALEEKNAKIVIMDEATAYIDERIEREFQNVVWREFVKSTVFIIAHRISNVVNCDRILVMDKGKVIENGSPKELLKNKESVFYELWSKNK